jgi:hypothetical protein
METTMTTTDEQAAVVFTDALDEAAKSWKEFAPEERILLSIGFHAGYHAHRESA